MPSGQCQYNPHPDLRTHQLDPAPRSATHIAQVEQRQRRFDARDQFQIVLQILETMLIDRGIDPPDLIRLVNFRQQDAVQMRTFELNRHERQSILLSALVTLERAGNINVDPESLTTTSKSSNPSSPELTLT